MRETVSALRGFNVLPDAGGWNDQDADWTTDVFTYLGLERRLKWEREQAKKGGDVLGDLLSDDSGSGAVDLFGGL